MIRFAPLFVLLLGASSLLAVDHPTLRHGIDESKRAEYEQLAEPAMAMSEAQWLSFVPDRNPSRYCECPECYGGSEGNHIFKWSVDTPDEMTCRFCGLVWPNEKYVEDRTLSGENALGETVTFQYYHGEEMDAPHFLSGNLAAWQSNWQFKAAEALGKMYQLTGDDAYAHRVAIAIDQLATYYPHYPVIQQLPRVFKFRESQEPPYEWDSGKWGFFHNEVPKGMLWAYDLTYDSSAYDELSKVRGYDVREHIENTLFRPTAEASMQSPYHMSNIIGYDVAGVAQMGQVIGEPRYVHWAYGKMRDVVEKGFFFDGLWHESPSYHYMTIGGLTQAFNTVRGYSDPPGYVDPVDGTRFDNFDPDADLPFWIRAKNAPAVIGYPDGVSATVHDTHPNEKRDEPRDVITSAIAPAFGHAVLGRGQGDHRMQAHLHFSGGAGHGHPDNLNLILWAKGREMAPDVGYTWSQLRHWATSTLAHNTVIIDRTSQTLPDSDGNLRMFYPDTNGVSVVEAEGRRAYPQTREDGGEYRRTLVMIPVSDEDAYVVDIFRVIGGRMHDWALHGDADHDTTATSSVALSGHLDNLLIEGEVWEEPTKQYSKYPVYGLVRDVQSGRTDDALTVTFDYEDDRALRTHLFSDGAEVLLGRSPSVRRMGYGANSDMRKAYDFWMPHLLVRREAQGDEPLSSVYMAVHEPYAGEPVLDRVERIDVSPADGAAALRVTHGNVTDTIIVTTDEAPYTWRQTPDGIKLRGRVAVVRKVDGRTQAAWLFDGSALGTGDRTIEQRQRFAGKLIDTLRVADGDAHDAFVVDGTLPAGDALKGRWMVVTHGNGLTHGYEIADVLRHERGSLVVLAFDPGITIDDATTREIYFPQRSFQGDNTFTIPLDATWRRPAD